jgi:hypothetical protein
MSSSSSEDDVVSQEQNFTTSEVIELSGLVFGEKKCGKLNQIMLLQIEGRSMEVGHEIYRREIFVAHGRSAEGSNR